MKKRVSLENFLYFSRGFRKKGVSAVVATVLIILITVAAVTIIWAAIIPMINERLSRGTVCLDAVSQLTLEDKGYTCISGSNLSIQIGCGPIDFGLADIQILISSDGSTESIRLVADTATVVGDLPGANEERIFIITDADMTTLAADIDEIAIAPIVSVGNMQEVCDAMTPVIVRYC